MKDFSSTKKDDFVFEDFAFEDVLVGIQVITIGFDDERAVKSGTEHSDVSMPPHGSRLSLHCEVVVVALVWLNRTLRYICGPIVPC